MCLDILCCQWGEDSAAHCCGSGMSCIPAKYGLILNQFCLPHTIKLPRLDAKASLEQKRERKLVGTIWVCVLVV